MKGKKTFKDIETLSTAKDKIEQLQEQYQDLGAEEKEKHFEDIVKLEEQVAKAEKRMIKRIKKVVVLNEMEQSKREGLGERISLFINYLKLDTNGEFAFDKTFSFIGEIYNFYPDFFLFYFMKVGAAIAAAIISLPIALGILVAITGVNLVRLLPYINSNKKLKYELQASGLYDKIVAFLKEKKIDHFELGDNSDEGTIEEYIQDEFGYGK